MKKQAAFSMMELLVASIIIGALMAVAIPAIRKVMEQTHVTVTKQKLQGLKSSVILYKQDKEVYPSSAEGLEALVPKYADKSELEDGWENKFEYNSPPTHFPDKYKQFEIVSYGSDGVVGNAPDYHAGM